MQKTRFVVSWWVMFRTFHGSEQFQEATMPIQEIVWHITHHKTASCYFLLIYNMLISFRFSWILLPSNKTRVAVSCFSVFMLSLIILSRLGEHLTLLSSWTCKIAKSCENPSCQASAVSVHIGYRPLATTSDS